MSDIKIEAIVSFIINIVLGAMVFTWACANLSSAFATVIGVAVLAIGMFFAVSFPRLIEKNK